MNVSTTNLEDAVLIDPAIFDDNRGWFFESYNKARYKEHGIDIQFIQDNRSYSEKNTIRGLHYQLMPGQSKLVEVIVDLRRDSKSYMKWQGFTLSSENHQQLLVPTGFAHGFCVLSDSAIMQYKVDQYYSPETERGIHYLDSELAIDWPITDEAILSDKDKILPPLSEAEIDF